MTKKPEILTGEVKEFIELAPSFEYSYELMVKFYSQPFQPEMIMEYFCDIERLAGEYLLDSNKGYANFGCYGNIFGRDKSQPKTLSQFITNTIQADIKLTWKEK